MCALLLAAAFAYDFTKPENGNELKATLKDEGDTTFIVFVHAVSYEDEDQSDVVKDMKEDVQKACTKESLKDEDYTYIDVEVELDGATETEALFGQLMIELGFEEEGAAAEEGDAAAEGEEGAAEEGAEEPAARRNL